MSPPELAFWYAVRAHRFHGLGFRRQVPIAGYVVDFICHERAMIVEIDGATHGPEAAMQRDAVRTRRLEAEGFRVVRFWNNDVMGNLDGVMRQLAIELGLEPSALERRSLPQNAHAGASGEVQD